MERRERHRRRTDRTTKLTLGGHESSDFRSDVKRKENKKKERRTDEIDLVSYY